MKKYNVCLIVFILSLLLPAGCAGQPETVLELSGGRPDEAIPADTGGEPSKAGETRALSPEPVKDREQGEKVIYVYLCGAVRRPGVYEAGEGTRLYSLIEMAGGLTEDAQESALNLASQAADGQRIYVPTREEIRESGMTADGLWQSGEGTENAQGRVNINRAGEAELQTLPGIGAAKAKSVIAYREQSGGFRTVEEIKQVTGIGDALYERIRDLIVAD